MKINYRGCELEAKKEICLGGWHITTLTIYKDNYEVISTFSESRDTVQVHINSLKSITDDFIDNYHQDTDEWENREE